jgi:hypothetical protein
MNRWTAPDRALAVMPGANLQNGNRTDEPNGPPHALWVQMSTIGQQATKRCAELANRAGQAGAGSRLKLLIEIRSDLDASAI